VDNQGAPVEVWARIVTVPGTLDDRECDNSKLHGIDELCMGCVCEECGG
jgi:hypothetical protein